MSKAHFIAPTSPMETALTVRLGTTGAKFKDTDIGKFVKLAAESQFNLCAVGDQIEGLVAAVETASSAGFSIGSIVDDGQFNVTFDGLQGTPGTGVVAIGDYVVCGTPVALNTAMTVFPKVCTATAAGNTLNYKWRVVSLGTAGTGAVGTSGVIMALV
jgi:hypothetical protein